MSLDSRMERMIDNSSLGESAGLAGAIVMGIEDAPSPTESQGYICGHTVHLVALYSWTKSPPVIHRA